MRLQKTVEGLSVVAISYYAVSLMAYVVYPVAEAAGHVSKGTLTAVRYSAGNGCLSGGLCAAFRKQLH